MAIAHEFSGGPLADMLEAIGLPLSDAAAAAVVTLAPLAPLAFGLRAFAHALKQRAHGHFARRIARRVRAVLAPEFIVLPHYLPRDSGDGEVDVVVVGPTGVFAIEVRAARGDVSCYQDLWFESGRGGSAGLADSPSRVARWNATRVQSDLAIHGFVRTPVYPLVVFVGGRIADVAASSVPVVGGVDTLIQQLTRPNGVAVSPQRARAIATALDARALAFAT